MRHHRRSYARTRGFTLLEALVALLVLSFGMLAIAGFQVTLSRSADLAKQRTEATRLAQQQVEKLRSFAQVEHDASGTVKNYTDDVVSSAAPETITNANTNATFSRTWTVTANAADTEKSVNVLVTWDDRAGQSQSVQLLSVIAKFDPQSIGTLATGPGGTGVRYPKNRNVNIPFPTVGGQGGKSAFVPPPGNVIFIFDNNTGQVVNRCTGSVTLTEGSDLLTQVSNAGGTCSNVDAYLLSGFVRFKGTVSGNQVTATELEDPFNFNPDTKELDPAQPLLIDSTDTGNAPSGVECFSRRQLTVKSTTLQPRELTIGESDPIPTGYSAGGPGDAPRFIAYLCVVTPIDHDNNAATPKMWSGQVNLVPDSNAAPGQGFVIGTSSAQRKVCRFTSDYDGNTRLSNREHPRYHRGVTAALSGQNFLVTAGDLNCPTDVAADPLNGDFADSNTVAHQPTAALSPNEPTNATTPIPMK